MEDFRLLGANKHMRGSARNILWYNSTLVILDTSMPAIKLLRSFAIFSIIILFALSCIRKKPEFSSQQLEKFNLLSSEADMFYESGSYVSLKKAFVIYEDQQTFPAFQNRTLRKLVKTALLLAIREYELSIIGDEYLTKALDLIDSFPVLSEFSSYAAIVFFPKEGVPESSKEVLESLELNG